MTLESDYDRLQTVKTLGEQVRIDGRELYGVPEYIEDLLDFDQDIEDVDYRLTVRSIDIEGVEDGAPVELFDEEFIIVSRRDDREGMTELNLVKA